MPFNEVELTSWRHATHIAPNAAQNSLIEPPKPSVTPLLRTISMSTYSAACTSTGEVFANCRFWLPKWSKGAMKEAYRYRALPTLNSYSYVRLMPCTRSPP